MLTTARLDLRPPARTDLPWLLAEMNTLAVLRHLGGAVRPAADVAADLDADIAAFEAGDWRRWTVWLRDDAVPIGRCGLFTLRSAAAPAALRGQREIGWTFAAPWWGKGYASEAARAVMAAHFADPAATQLWAQTSDSNAASTRMMGRLGFARSAAHDYDDPAYPAADNPTTVYRLTREAWARGL